MNRGSPKPWFAHSAHLGQAIPSRHWPAASSQDAEWNPRSCPDACPSQKNGAITSNAVASETPSASSHSRELVPRFNSFGSSTEDVMQCSYNSNRYRNEPSSFMQSRAAAPQLSDNTRAYEHRKRHARSDH